ncbi:carbohydrate sulfotransferase 9-like isoform X2 [Mytilus trossulus]|uniref:carbohydrate sulfotransferase 9-like isoform X2 n=1 Tax=Mytilus trossulus TaxID=6551 RepID=UPI003006B216
MANSNRFAKLVLMTIAMCFYFLPTKEVLQKQNNVKLLACSQLSSTQPDTRSQLSSTQPDTRSQLSSTQPDTEIRSKQQKQERLLKQREDNCRDYRISKQAIYRLKEYWSSPIVVPKYKLIFFWNEKSACTYWKKLFQFIQGIKNTEVHNHRNGLATLNSFDICEIIKMMYNESWVKAVFVREPRERLLSSNLEKGRHQHVMYQLCRVNRTVTFYEFLEIIKHCKNGHWDKQVRIPEYLYEQMMVGKLSEISSFTERLFKKIGAWNEKVVAWLQSSEKLTRDHRSDAKSKLLQYYNGTKTGDLIFDLFPEDYRVFGFSMTNYNKINNTTT